MYYYVQNGYQWDPPETAENLALYQYQYIRVHIRDMGWVVAQLLGVTPAGVVTLNVYVPGSRQPQFLRINQADLTGLMPLGYNPPYDIYGSYDQNNGYYRR